MKRLCCAFIHSSRSIVQALASDRWGGNYRSIIDRDWFSSGTTNSLITDQSYVLSNLVTENIIRTSGKWAIEIVRKSDGVWGRVEYTGSPKDVFTCVDVKCQMTYASKFIDSTGTRYNGNTKVCYNRDNKYPQSSPHPPSLFSANMPNHSQVPRLSRRWRHELHGPRLRFSSRRWQPQL